jgi:hypothetical protein
MHPMTTSTPNPDPAPDKYIPGVCLGCHRPAPVLVLDGSGYDGEGCCKRCVDELYALMSDNYTPEPSAWWPGVEADHPDWY